LFLCFFVAYYLDSVIPLPVSVAPGWLVRFVEMAALFHLNDWLLNPPCSPWGWLQ